MPVAFRLDDSRQSSPGSESLAGTQNHNDRPSGRRSTSFNFQTDLGSGSDISADHVELNSGKHKPQHHPVLRGKRLSDLDDLLLASRRSREMSLLSSARGYTAENSRYMPGMGQAGRYRVNIQIGNEQIHVMLRLPETRTFNFIMDEIQPMFELSDYQRVHTRIYLQTIVGETEILVNSRPNYATERSIDYIGIPANPKTLNTVQRWGPVWLGLFVVTFLIALGAGAFIMIEFFVLRPRLQTDLRRSLSALSQSNPAFTVVPAAVPVATLPVVTDKSPGSKPSMPPPAVTTKPPPTTAPIGTPTVANPASPMQTNVQSTPTDQSSGIPSSQNNASLLPSLNPTLPPTTGI